MHHSSYPASTPPIPPPLTSYDKGGWRMTCPWCKSTTATSPTPSGPMPPSPAWPYPSHASMGSMGSLGLTRHASSSPIPSFSPSSSLVMSSGPRHDPRMLREEQQARVTRQFQISKTRLGPLVHPDHSKENKKSTSSLTRLPSDLEEEEEEEGEEEDEVMRFCHSHTPPRRASSPPMPQRRGGTAAGIKSRRGRAERTLAKVLSSSSPCRVVTSTSSSHRSRLGKKGSSL
ncbi:MAG: hypothetical protein DHS80DRAFT_26133 [Piptocephalis tieghemiana]|nr:MAG: hypothetical protein DHS80DRAFT_26133 [Piptocephalis tieghemiana]